MELQTEYKEATAALIALCKKGDEAAFSEIYRLYSKAMFNVCTRMLGNRADAEDVLQESFISAFKNIAQYNSKGTFGSWLKRIVINRSIDAIKKRNADAIPLEAMEYASADETQDEATELSVEGVLKAMEQLPDGYRLILSLYLFEDHSHKDIALKLGISEGTSKSQYSRARKKLYELVQLNKKSNER